MCAIAVIVIEVAGDTLTNSFSDADADADGAAIVVCYLLFVA